MLNVILSALLATLLATSIPVLSADPAVPTTLLATLPVFVTIFAPLFKTDDPADPTKPTPSLIMFPEFVRTD